MVKLKVQARSGRELVTGGLSVSVRATAVGLSGRAWL